MKGGFRTQVYLQETCSDVQTIRDSNSIWITKGSDNGDSDNRGSTVPRIFIIITNNPKLFICSHSQLL